MKTIFKFAPLILAITLGLTVVAVATISTVNAAERATTVIAPKENTIEPTLLFTIKKCSVYQFLPPRTATPKYVTVCVDGNHHSSMTN